MILDLGSNNEIQVTESKGQRKEVGIQTVIYNLNIAGHPLI